MSEADIRVSMIHSLASLLPDPFEGQVMIAQLGNCHHSIKTCNCDSAITVRMALRQAQQIQDLKNEIRTLDPSNKKHQ